MINYFLLFYFKKYCKLKEFFFIYRLSFNQLKSLFFWCLNFHNLDYGIPFNMIPVSFWYNLINPGTFSCFLPQRYIPNSYLPAQILSHFSMKCWFLAFGNVFRNQDLVLIIDFLNLLVMISVFHRHKLRSKKKKKFHFPISKPKFSLLSEN